MKLDFVVQQTQQTWRLDFVRIIGAEKRDNASWSAGAEINKQARAAPELSLNFEQDYIAFTQRDERGEVGESDFHSTGSQGSYRSEMAVSTGVLFSSNWTAVETNGHSRNSSRETLAWLLRQSIMPCSIERVQPKRIFIYSLVRSLFMGSKYRIDHWGSLCVLERNFVREVDRVSAFLLDIIQLNVSIRIPGIYYFIFMGKTRDNLGDILRDPLPCAAIALKLFRDLCRK